MQDFETWKRFCMVTRAYMTYELILGEDLTMKCKITKKKNSFKKNHTTNLQKKCPKRSKLLTRKQKFRPDNTLLKLDNTL